MDSGWVNNTLNQMTLQEKVGQIFCPFMLPHNIGPVEQVEAFAERTLREIETLSPGGYFLNRYYPHITQTLIQLAQKHSKIPLFITADMEAGAGSGLGGVIAPDKTSFPPAMALGATRFEPYAYHVGYQSAWQARSLGVNYIFAPSLDINNNPSNPIVNVRSFGEDPEHVAHMAAAMIHGFRDGGVISCAKHFPGHGDTKEDTHLQLARIDAGRQRLDQVELFPYCKLMKEPGFDSIMTAHIAVPALEPENIPATISKRILTGLLRDEMGFDGLIVTDALLMGGITKVLDPIEAAIQSIEAGVDWLLLPPDFNTAHNAVLLAVENGRISEERLNESVQRILQLKSQVVFQQVAFQEDEPEFSFYHRMDEAERISYTISGDAVTMVKNKHNTLPLDPDSPTAVIICSDKDDNELNQANQFIAEIDERCFESHYITVTPDPDEHLPLHDILQDATTVIFAAIINVLPDKGSVDVAENFARLIDETVESGKRVVLVAFGNPYIISRFPNIPAFLCGYGYTTGMASAVVEVLYGERKPNGQLPVSLK